jgi:hypothetical protein
MSLVWKFLVGEALASPIGIATHTYVTIILPGSLYRVGIGTTDQCKLIVQAKGLITKTLE